jgi:hypothetical protein
MRNSIQNFIKNIPLKLHIHMQKIAFTLLLIGLILIGTSIPMEPFRLDIDGNNPIFSVPDGNSLAFSAAREKAVTAKFALQDYGITLLICSAAVFLFNLYPLKAPQSRSAFIGIAISAPSLTAAALVFDLLLGNFRIEYPPWADSLGAPLMGVPVLLISGLAWTLGHFTLLAGVPQKGAKSLSYAAVRHGHLWLLVMSIIATLITLVTFTGGVYWYAIPSALWLYFYVSIATVRQNVNQPN